MKFKKSKVIDIKDQRGDDNMDKHNQTKEGLKERGLKEGLKLLAITSVAGGLYGFKLGRRYGFNKGHNVGYQKATVDIVSAWKELTEEMIRARGK